MPTSDDAGPRPTVAGHRVVVTGGPGILGRQFVPRLVDDGFEVKSIALEPWPDAPCEHTVCDLTDLGQTIEVVAGAESVLHLAAMHREGVVPPTATFTRNVTSTYNVFRAADLMNVPRVVSASSAHAGGGRWSRDHVPTEVPIRESDAYQTADSYGLSKLVGEFLATHQRAWRNVMSVTLRYGYVHAPDQYHEIQARWDDPVYWAHSLWNYVDARDAYDATRLALTVPLERSLILNVTALDQSMPVPTRELVRDHLPGCTVADDLPEFGSLISTQQAQQLLGFKPRYSWRDMLGTT